MRIVPNLLLAAALGLSAPLAFAQDHAHQHAAPAAQATAPAQRYATDAPLRENMAAIREIVQTLEHAEHSQLADAEVSMLAGKVNHHVNQIIANCKLPPDADAALHEIIVPMVQEAGKLKNAPQDLSPVAALREGLATYDARFKE